MSTLKKLLLGTICVLGLGTFLFGTDLFSYIGTATGNIRQSVTNQVPIEFEIDRAKNQVAGLLPEIKTNMDTIAKEEVELERLDKQIAKLETRIADSKDEILTLQGDLTTQATAIRFTYSGRTYTRSQVESDLDNRLKRHQVDETTLDSLTRMRQVRHTSLQTARQQLSSYLAAKRELEVQIEQLVARKKMVDLAKTTSEFHFEDGSLGEVKSLVADIDARIAVEERLLGTSSDLANEVVLTDKTENSTVTDRVADHFGLNDLPVAKVASAQQE